MLIADYSTDTVRKATNEELLAHKVGQALQRGRDKGDPPPAFVEHDWSTVGGFTTCRLCFRLLRVCNPLVSCAGPFQTLAASTNPVAALPRRPKAA